MHACAKNKPCQRSKHTYTPAVVCASLLNADTNQPRSPHFIAIQGYSQLGWVRMINLTSLLVTTQFWSQFFQCCNSQRLENCEFLSIGVSNPSPSSDRPQPLSEPLLTSRTQQEARHTYGSVILSTCFQNLCARLECALVYLTETNHYKNRLIRIIHSWIRLHCCACLFLHAESRKDVILVSIIFLYAVFFLNSFNSDCTFKTKWLKNHCLSCQKILL